MTRLACLVGLGLAFVAGPAAAQNVVVTKEPGAWGWTVSFDRFLHEESIKELSAQCGTLALAKQHAAELKAGNAKRDKTKWSIRTIFIEGDDWDQTPEPKKTGGFGPKTPDFFQAVHDNIERGQALLDRLKPAYEVAMEAKDVVEKGKWLAELAVDPKKTLLKEVDGVNEKVEKAIKEDSGLRGYVKSVQNAYQRAKDAKDELLAGTGKRTDDAFAKVNAAVDRFNKQAADAPAGFGAATKLIPGMTRVGPETVKQADAWRDAVRDQFKLERQKETLDANKSALDAKRQQLLAEWNRLGDDPDPADPQVVRLRDRLARYKEQAAEYQTAVAEQAAAVRRLDERARQFRPVGGPEAVAEKPKPQPADERKPLTAFEQQFVGVWVNRTGDRVYTRIELRPDRTGTDVYEGVGGRSYDIVYWEIKPAGDGLDFEGNPKHHFGEVRTRDGRRYTRGSLGGMKKE